MAHIQKLSILNPADKTHMYAVAIGEGAPTDKTDPLVADSSTYTVGSQYTDTLNKKFYVRVAKTGNSNDWMDVSIGQSE